MFNIKNNEWLLLQIWLADFSGEISNRICLILCLKIIICTDSLWQHLVLVCLLFMTQHTHTHTHTHTHNVYGKHSEVCDALLPTYATADGWLPVWTGWWKWGRAGGNKKSRLTFLCFGPQLIGLQQSWRTSFTLLNQLISTSGCRLVSSNKRCYVGFSPL